MDMMCSDQKNDFILFFEILLKRIHVDDAEMRFNGWILQNVTGYL